jgi:hypothetical protein
VKRLAHKRAALSAVAVLALVVAGGTALAAGLGGSTVKKGILTYDASAVASPTPTLIGTTLGDTWYATCDTLGAAKADLKLYIQTSDGSLNIETGDVTSDPGLPPAFAARLVLPPGTLPASPSMLADTTAQAGGTQVDVHLDLLQLGDKTRSGRILIHLNALTTATPTQACHVAIEVSSDKIARTVGSSTATPTSDLSRLLLTH